MTRVQVRIPTPLRSFVDGRSVVELEARTAEEALFKLTESHPALQAQLYAEDGRLRRFVNVYVGDREVREPGAGEAPLQEGAELRIVPSIAGGGPGDGAATMQARPDAGSANVPLGRSEMQRYSRHFMLPEVGLEGQRKLKGARVLLVGAGGLGSPLGLYLAAAGVGRLGIVDHDVVDITNLQRQILHDTASVGRPKLQSARERLRALNPEVDIRTYETRLDSSNALEIFEGWDLVADGSDNFPTRYLVNDASVILGIPSVWGAIYRFEGQVSVFGSPGGPCYRCLFPEPPPPGLVPSCADAGVLGVLPGIVGAIQATEVIKIVLEVGTGLAGRLLLIDALQMDFREARIRKDPDCPVCGANPTITRLIDYEVFCGAGASAAESETGDEIPEIEVAELRRMLESGEPVQLVDVREPYEWEICNLGSHGARFIPLGELPERLDELSGSGPLVVHCRSGARSAKAVELLRRAGFANATNLQGGILAWAHEIDPEMATY
ncbi:MAG: molybdopterin-synthase adenylyltransferase MoeB [Gemmatimonadota bacterium]